MGIAKLLIECFQRDERWVLLSFLLEGFSHRERGEMGIAEFLS